MLTPAELNADDAKVRLMVTAETLFYDRTIDSVSLREIAVRAGNGNNNAVQYHFGDRDVLIQSIFAWRVWQMEPDRLAALDQAEVEGRLHDLEQLLRILCLPLMKLTNEAGQHTYAGFMHQYILTKRPAGMSHAADLAVPDNRGLRRVLDLIHQATRLYPGKGGHYQVGLAHLVFANMLVLSDSEELPRKDPAGFAVRVDETLRTITRGLSPTS